MTWLKQIKKYLGEIMVVLGTGTFSYNIFNFSFTDWEGLRLPSLGGELGNVAYYYTDEALLGIALGAMLIVLGILVIRNRNK